MKRKKLISLALVATFLISSFTVTSYAATDMEDNVNLSVAESDKAYHGVIDLSSELKNTKIMQSQVMTFEEMVNCYADKKGLSYEDALKQIPANIKDDAPNRAIGYITRSVTLNVKPEYKPELEFFCQVAYGGHFYNIQSIYAVELNRNYKGLSKQFKGKVQAWLRSTQDIEYLVNGDFYNNGKTTISGGINIGVGKMGSITFNISNASGHYKYFYEHDWAR